MRVPNYKLVLKETGTYNADARKKYNDPQLIAEFALMQMNLTEEVEEYVEVFCMDTQYHLMCTFEASHGAATGTMFAVREIFQKALIAGAVNIIVVHNHPSGDVEPSADDIASTRQLAQAGKIIGINVADHIIVGKYHDYYSFNQEGQL